MISGSGRFLMIPVLFGVFSACSIAHEVEGLRLWSSSESTRFVIDLSTPAEHRVFSLDNPSRIVIDLDDTSISETERLPEKQGFVNGIRTGKQIDGRLRVVLDVSQSVKPQSFLLEPNQTYGHRLVVDLISSVDAIVVKRALRSAVEKGRSVIIAIDAGHGGDDPGATGSRGVREKNVVLGIARSLSSEVEAQPGMKPILIRDGDYYLPLRSRIERAREASADLFVSIHADAFRDSSVRGATVYVLSEKGATDEAAIRLAKRENDSDLIGGVSLADKEPLLARVLLDLSQSAAISASATAGERIISRLSSVTPMRKTRVQRAPFLVLKSPDIPSILVETAYISNPNQESELRTSRYQKSLARAIHHGILDYFRDNPPPESYLAFNPPPARKNPVRHVISSGETLSEIAQRYKVSLSDLKHSNALASNVIRIGQIITIPVT